MSPCYQVGVSWYGKERENLMWLGKGFFFCRSNNINLRQKPKNNILRGCFCRYGEPIFVSAGRSTWQGERLAWRGDAVRSGTVIIVQRQSLFYRGRKG